LPWKETSPMDQRLQFVSDHQRGVSTMVELCARYGISRKTGYKWIGRYDEDGPTGLLEQSRRPDSCPHATDPRVMEALLELRRRHPRWGPKKLVRVLGRRHPQWALPAASTLGSRLKREGLAAPAAPRRARPGEHPGPPHTPMDAANAVWTIDFKGQFRVGTGAYCYPLTVMDGWSRYLLGCEALTATTHEQTRRAVARIFDRYGLPAVIRSDNGIPFAGLTLARLSRLSIWWIRLGIRPELIEPGHPQQNGRHERFHRTLKAETTQPPAATPRAQQTRFRRFRCEYNSERPHEALDHACPDDRYVASPRRLPARLPLIDYPAHFDVRRVAANGCFYWHQHYVTVGQLLTGEDIGLEEIDDGMWNVFFGPVYLGRFDERTLRFIVTTTRQPAVEAAGLVDAQTASTKSLENAQSAFPTAPTSP
jgi:putative transposase